MIYYNLYYGDIKLNNRPINKTELNSIKESKTIYKRNNITEKLEEVPIDKIRIIKTILI